MKNHTIWKFSLVVRDGPQEVAMPRRAIILDCFQQDPLQECDGLIQFWALVNPNMLLEIRTFRIYGTGHPIADEQVDQLAHIATVPMLDGKLIWHVFEIVTRTIQTVYDGAP